jgi:ornithine--oxo-acid transaminase
LIENSFELGNFFLEGLKSIKSDMIKEVRGKGLMCAIEFHENLNRETAWECCLRLKGKGILAKPT